MFEPLVSIIIPVFNAEKYLDETISSALGQTYSNKELIIIDDGSEDSSLAIAKKYASENVKVFNQANRGASAARNLGLKEAKGKFIQFLDADDLLSPDKIAQQVEALEHAPGKIAVCNIIKFRDNLKDADHARSQRNEPYIYSTDDVVDFLIDLYGGYKKRGAMVGIHSWLIPASMIEKTGLWNEDLTVDDDGEFFCRVVLNSAGIIRTGGLCYYRITIAGQTNLSARGDQKSLQSMVDSFRLKKKHLLERTNSDAAHFALYKQTLNIAIRTYIVAPELYRQMNEELRKYPYYDYKPIIGGKVLNLVSDLFGWRVSRFLQYQYSKLNLN